MLARTLKIGSILLLALASACASSPDDSIWMPAGGAGGKADGFTTIKGSDIPSAYVDASKSYMIARKIANLSTVGALDATETKLAGRIDGIIANLPADGQMSLAELVRMENPTINSSLFADEKAALPKLWKLMEAPDSNDTLYGPKDNFGIVDDSAPPAAAVPPASLAITSLATALQDPATRLENVYDSDGDTTTVTLSDLAMGVANPASFTPTEVTAFGTIQAVFRTQAVATSAAQIVVSPGPGTVDTTGSLGGASYRITGTVEIDEDRNLNYTTLTTTLVAKQSLAANATLPTGAQVLVINQDTGAETVFGAGTVPSFPGGEYLYEVWKAGARSFSTNAELPAMTTQSTIDLGNDLDYTLTSGLTDLVRNVRATTGSGYTTSMHATFDTAAVTPPAMVDANVVKGMSSPTVTLPVGRYSFPQQNVVLYVYPNNVVWVSMSGSMARMFPTGNYGQAPNVLSVRNGQNATFNASSNQLSCPYQNLNVTLNASMRDI